MPASLNGAVVSPAQIAVSNPSISRSSLATFTALGETNPPHLLSLVLGRAASAPTTVGGMDQRQLVALDNIDSLVSRKSAGTYHIEGTHGFAAFSGCSVGDKIWLTIVSADPTVTGTAIDLVAGPFLVVA